MKQDLFGKPFPNKAAFHIYHDESEPNKRWFLIGVLFIPSSRLETVTKTLNYYREQENYFGELHFSELQKHFLGRYGGRPRVALHWIRAYERGLSEHAFFTALAVDRYSPRYERKRFCKDFHAYNRFTAMAIKSGIAWHLLPYGYQEVDITIISDSKNRRSRPEEGFCDNFESYVPYKVESETIADGSRKRQPYPKVSIKPIQLLDSKTNDLLQLNDILLGSLQEAIVAEAQRETKRRLAEIVYGWCRDIRNKPWEQKHDMHRKFNLWGFPDINGRPFDCACFDFGIRKIVNPQQSLF